MIGRRCVLDVDPSSVEQFTRKHRAADSTWAVGGEIVRYRFHVSDGMVILELSAARQAASSSDVDHLFSLFRAVDRAFDAEFDRYPQDRQEFVVLDLPGSLSPRTSEQVAVELHRLNDDAVRKSGAPSIELNTLTVTNRRITFGPEVPGALKALHDYLEEQERLVQTEPIPAPTATTMVVPWVLAGLLLATWILPLTPMLLGSAFGTMCIPMGFLIWKARDVGWKGHFLRTGTLSAVALFTIAFFGLLYGICALTGSGQPAAQARLGEPFLIATSLGLAGGVVGEALSGPALVIAHIQLLLFLGSLAALLAAVLRIDDGFKRPQ